MKDYGHVIAVAQGVAKGFHDGIVGLAKVMHKSPIILANKLNPNCDTNALTLEEAAEITVLRQSPAIANALAALVDHVCVPLPKGQSGLTELSRAFCKIAKEVGHVGQQIEEAERPDGEWGEEISPAERARIAKELRDVLSAAAGLLAQVEG